MNKLQSFRRIYWKIIAAWARITGFAFIAVGLYMGGWSCLLLANEKATVNWNGQNTNDVGLKLIILLVSLVVVGLGILLLKAKGSVVAATKGKSNDLHP